MDARLQPLADVLVELCVRELLDLQEPADDADSCHVPLDEMRLEQHVQNTERLT